MRPYGSNTHGPTLAGPATVEARRDMNLVDLFSGCGGFSLGAHRAGFDVVAAFDNDPVLASSYRYNFPKTRMVFRDVADVSGDMIRAAAGGNVGGVFGGPPCQGFSDIGLRRPEDPRRQLLGHFFRIVRESQPTFFAMENVRGLGYSGARGTLDDALRTLGDRYAVLGPVMLNAADFGAATNRSRLFVIGIHKDRGEAVSLEHFDALKRPSATVRAAIADMEGAVAVGVRDGFDTWRITRSGRPFEYARALRSSDGLFTGHRTTEHCGRVVARFAAVPPGGSDPIGRHPRLVWSGQCPTLRAGTGPDRGSHQAIRPIHPDYPRVITVREAARLQGFPDCHRFHSTIWHSFRMIGNSVSPIIAKAIFGAIDARLDGRRYEEDD